MPAAIKTNRIARWTDLTYSSAFGRVRTPAGGGPYNKIRNTGKRFVCIKWMGGSTAGETPMSPTATVDGLIVPEIALTRVART
jgi:hypothetical protein